MGPRQPHPYHYPPSPLQTPPGTAIHPTYYQQTPQAPAHYLPPRTLHNYTSPRSEYGSQYASSTNGHPQPRRPSFAQRYQAGGGVMNTPEHSHPLRRLSSQGYPHTYPMSSAGSVYGYEDPVDDNPIYSSQSASGTLSPSAAYDADPHGNIYGLIQRTQGALQSLTMPIHSLQHLCDRHRVVNDELEKFQHIADEQEKDMRELRAKEVELEGVKLGLEQNLDMSAAELDDLKRQLSNLEAEVRGLSETVEDKDEEKSRLEQRLSLEKEALTVEYKNWKRDILEAHEADRHSITTAHDAEKRIMETKFLSKQRSIEASHSTDKIRMEEMHLASSKKLEEAHANEIRRLKDSHKGKLAMAQQTHESTVGSLEKSHHDNTERLRAEFSAEKSGMQVVFGSERRKLEEGFAHQKALLQDSFIAEKNSMETEFASQKRKIEERFSSQKRTLELQFNREIEDLRQISEAEKSELQKALESAKMEWRKEKREITAKFNDDKTGLDQMIHTLEEEKRTAAKDNLSLSADKSALLGQKATLEDAVATLEVDKALLISRAQHQKSELETQKQKLEAEVKDLGNVRDALRREVRSLKEVIKRTAEEEEGEDRKGRGDGYYIDAFTKLSKDIVDLSKEFSNLPMPPTGRVLAELPSGLPCMLVNTDASRLIRMAYVQHIISKYLCYRIFQPFLFYLGKRYDKADSFFQVMSKQLREKSTRKEATWRYYTLLVGYSGSNAKRTAGVAAANVIEEIAEHVKPFADQQRMDVITSGISRIVKFAVETWRHARIERETFTASMSLDRTNQNSWLGHFYENEKPYADNPALVAKLKSLRCRHEIILPLLPVFSREGTLPSLHRPGALLDNGLVFSKGVALYMDCLPALQRSIETSPLGSVPALPIDAELVTTQENSRLSPVPEGEDGYKATAAGKEVKKRPLKEQADVRAKEEAKRQVKEEAEAMVRREEERVVREEAERLVAENAEREVREAADKAAAEETTRTAADLAETEAADKASREEKAADLTTLEEGLSRLVLETGEEHQESQELESLDCKHQADVETTSPNEETPTEAALADNEAWGGDEETEIERVVQQALINTQTAEDESLSVVDPNSVDSFVASPEPDAVSPDQAIAAPSITSETEKTDDTAETALEQQPDVSALSNTAHPVSLPQTAPAPEGRGLATEDNIEGAEEIPTEIDDLMITDDENRAVAQGGPTEDLQNAVEGEAVTLPSAELEPAPLAFKPEGESLPDTITAETPQGASTDVPVPELPNQKNGINNKEENPAEAVGEGLEERSSEPLIDNPKIPSTNTPIEVDPKNPISFPEGPDAASVSAADMTDDRDTSTSTATGLVINDALNGSTLEIPNFEGAPIEHPALYDIPIGESKAGDPSTKVPITQDSLAIEMEAVEPATEEPKIENSMIEEFAAAEVSKVKGSPLNELGATRDIEVDLKFAKLVPQIMESKGEALGTELKDSKTGQSIAAVEELKTEEPAFVESRTEDPTAEEPNAKESTTKELVAGDEELGVAVQESETVIVDPKSEVIELNDKADQPKALESSSPEAEERKLQGDGPMPNTGNTKSEDGETMPKPVSAIIGMSSMGLSKPSLSGSKTRGPSPGNMLFSNLRHSASMSEKRNSPSITADEAKVGETLAEGSRPNTPESMPPTPTSPSPGLGGRSSHTEPPHRAANKQKRKKGKKGR
ncbi:hypothetical protein HOY82DRAFT_581765 [Tuber indicum]|nr:hypothetical protein HOY82DRAFT_581765 [Tuber indicum]